MQNIFNTLALLVFDKKARALAQQLNTTAATTANLVYKKSLYQLSKHLQKGGLLKHFWKKQKNRLLFPVLVRRMLTLGERQGNYIDYIQTVSRSLTQELDNQLKRFITMLEPVLIILIACVVVLLALGLQNILAQAYTAI